MEHKIISGMAQGFSNTFLLYTACKLNLFDVLVDSDTTVGSEVGVAVGVAIEAGATIETGVTIESIGVTLKVERGIIERLIRPLVVYGYISEDSGRYSLTELGRLLAGDTPGSLKGYVLFCGGICAKCWSVMPESALTDEVPYHLATKNSLFADNEKDEYSFAAFDAMMNYTSMNVALGKYLKGRSDKEQVSAIVDVGGGTGAVLIQFLQYYDSAQGMVYDLDFVKDRALANITKHGLQERAGFVSGDFFRKEVISGDRFILSRILHDWSDEDSVRILTNIRNAMHEDSILYVLEQIIPEQIEKSGLDIYMNDLQMWAICGGKERKLREFQVLFRLAGLVCVRNQRLESGEVIMEVVVWGDWLEEGVL
ncbi:MAG: methyltransferase [Lachnospiraceae bacterium]